MRARATILPWQTACSSRLSNCTAAHLPEPCPSHALACALRVARRGAPLVKPERRDRQCECQSAHQNAKAEEHPLSESVASGVILRNKITVGKVVAKNGISGVYGVEKIHCRRDIYPRLRCAAEDDVGRVSSSGIDVFSDHLEHLGLHFAASNAL